VTIVVGICTYRRPEGLARLLAALPEGCGGLSPIVLVVDNDGSDPRVREIAGRAGLDVRLVEEPRPGISAARNRVFAEAEAAGATLLAMLDDDEWPAPGWLPALLERRRETGAGVVGGVVQPCFPEGTSVPERHRRFWSVLPQRRGGRPFVHATSNVLIDLAAVAGLPRPLFDDAFGLSGGGDLVFFSRLFDLGIRMAWAERALAFEEVPPARAAWIWLRRRRHRVGNHMVMDEELRQGRLRPMLKTAGVAARLPVYPLLGREPGARWIGWRLEAAKLGGRITAHLGLRAFEYARDGAGLRLVTRPSLRRARASRNDPARPAPPRWRV
jgi:succinoglycan biosynthesis protein ExoM